MPSSERLLRVGWSRWSYAFLMIQFVCCCSCHSENHWGHIHGPMLLKVRSHALLSCGAEGRKCRKA